MSFSPALSVYRGASSLLGAFAGAWLHERAKTGKEDPQRIGERFARYTQSRPNGTLIWLHAASVGESSVALAVIEALAARDPELLFLLSTGTRTSAELVARRAPARTTHIYAPLDRIDVVKRFLAYWRPHLGVLVESEVWPNLILEAQAANLTLVLANARMSPKSLSRWTSWGAAGARLMRAFAWVSAADARTAEAIGHLRDEPVPTLGNLKLAAPPPRVDAALRASLAQEIGARLLWLAASTHEGEDAIVLAAHDILRKAHPDALLIIAPRHPERGEDVSVLAGDAPMRSRGQTPGGAPVYVADTLGELGAFYDLAPVTLVAGSLLPSLKGHNPVEPAKLNAAIVTGPYVESFEDLYAALFAAGGAVKAADPETIAQTVSLLWNDDAKCAAMLEAARHIADTGAEAMETTLANILALLPQPARGLRQINASA